MDERVFQDTVDKFTEALTQITNQICNGGSPVCMLRISRLEQSTEANRRAIYGANGDQGGMIADLDVINVRIKNVQNSQREMKESQKNLNKILITLATGVLLTLAGTIINLVAN